MNCKVKTKQNLKPHGKTSSIEIENNARDIIYSVGTDRVLNLKEIIADIHGANSEVMTAVKELDEFLSRPDPTQYAAVTELRHKIESILTPSSDKKQQTEVKKMIDRFNNLLRFENRSEVRKFTCTVNRRIHNWSMAKEIASELVNEGYIISLKKLGYKDAPRNIAFSKDYAQKHGITFAEAFMFGLGGSARIALFEWLIEKNLHGMHRPGKGPGSAFSEETKKTWYLAEYKHQPWPYIENADGEIYLAEIPAERGKLPQGVEELMRDSWRRYLRKGRDYTYTGMRPLRCGQNYQMIEDMVCTLLEDEGRPKMYRSPLSRSQQLRYNRIIENANRMCVDPFYAVYSEMFSNPDTLKPIWDKARRILYDYSGVIRQSAIDAGLIEKPDSIGITWRNRQKVWQAQIVSKGRQKYLGLFKNKADAQAAYYEAAAETGHIPGLPDIDKIWPTWEREKARLALMDEHPRMPVIYQQQDTHEERKFGLRPPKHLRDFVERMANIDWLAKHCILAFDDNRPVASREVTIESRGANWYAEIKKQGKRPVIYGSTSIDRETGRIQITIYNQGFDNKRVLVEEIYHIGFKIIRLRETKIFEAIQRWYNRQLKRGCDPTFSMPDMFSTNMAIEECGEKTSLDRQIVKCSQNIFSVTNRIPDSVMKEVKTKWSVL